MILKELKLYDERDYDYYNPHPYFNHLISFCNTEMQNSMSYDMDDKIYDYLFMYTNADDEQNERKKRRVFRPNILLLIKIDHAGRVKRALERVVDNYARNLDDKVKSYKERIRRAENDIKTQLETIEREKKELKEVEDVIAKYQTKNQTGTPQLPF